MRLPAAVLDASITAAWLLPDEASDASQRVYVLMRRGTLVLHAPELWLWECGNIIANGVKRRRLTIDDAFLTWSVLDSIRVRVELTSPEPAQIRASLGLALDHGLSLYDAAYLWLAMSLRLPLLTTDRTLAAAAAKKAIRVVGLEEVE
jgi:predicted nucleic acid-binding protein